MKTKLFALLLLTGCFLMASCERNTDHRRPGSSNVNQKRVPAVCIVDEASLRGGPSAEAEWQTSISLGEKVTWLGIGEKDSTKENREYYKVELSDSSVGWTTAFALELNAEPAVILQRATVYRRPDLKTMTDNEFAPMDFVAIIATDADWLQVKGENRKKQGWIERSAASLREDDIAVGVLAAKALKEKNADKRRQKIVDLVENPAFANSSFIDDLVEILNSGQNEQN